MKMHGTSNGSAWIPSLIGIVVLALFVLVLFGATPSDILQIPQITFNNLKPASAAKTDAAPDASATPAASPATPISTPTPTPAILQANPLGNSGLK
jgi:hypothetical protein